MRERERWASLVSGGGTTMQKMIRECQSGGLPIDIACVISSNPTAGAINKAMDLGIPSHDVVVVDPRDFRNNEGGMDQEEFGFRIVEVLREHGATVVTQNGWLPLTPEVVIREFSDCIYNQHPGPVPDFGGEGMYGIRVHAAVLLFNWLVRRKKPWTEVIAQRVHPEFDQGCVVRSERIIIPKGETVATLQERALPIEHGVQTGLLYDIANGTIREETNRERVVRPGEEPMLATARRLARLLYPHG